MGTVRNVALVVLAISFFTFAAFFGRLPLFRNTPIGALHRLLWIHIPKAFSRADRLLTGGRLVASASRLGNHLLYEKHPLVLCFFLGLLTGSSLLFLPPTWPYLTNGQKITVFLLLPWPYIFTYLCQRSSASSPHLITPATSSAQLRHYPFDHILYHANNICRTCALPKPARSKHCSLCKTCVARADHHCVWVNNCVGRGNYKYFLGLLLLTSCVLFYGAYLAYATLMPEVNWHFKNYPGWHTSSFADRSDFIGRQLGRLDYLTDVVSTAFMVGGLGRGGVGLLATLTAPLPLGLLAYHIYLIWAGMTTNETAKWSDWREDMNDGLVFAADVKGFGYERAEGLLDSMRGSFHEQEQDEYEWPHRSKQFLVRTTDGQPPKFVPVEIQRLVVENSWRRCWRLADVENIYDLGFWGNLWEVLVN